MAYVQLDDQIAQHPKVLAAGAEAAWLWACAIAYCNRQLTDGAVPVAALSTLGVFRTPVRKLAATLVTVGLFEVDGDDFRVHDYLQHNPDKATVLARMKAAADRKAAYRARKGHPDTPSPDRDRDAAVHTGRTRMSQRDNDGTRASSRAHVPTPTPTPTPTDTQNVSVGDARARVEPTHTLVPSDAWLSLVECWNAVAGTVPTWHVVRTENVHARSRQRLLSALQATPDLDAWEARFARAAKSAWLTGQRAGRDGRPFTADLWWLCEHADELDAGRYDDKAAPSTPAVDPYADDDWMPTKLRKAGGAA